MFRTIDPDPVFNPVAEDIAWEPPFDSPPSDEWEMYLHDAALLKTQYDFELNGLLRTWVYVYILPETASRLDFARYNICEAECVSGVLLRSRSRRGAMRKCYSLSVGLFFHLLWFP